MKKKFLIVTTVSDSLPFFKGQINVLKQGFDIELASSSGKHLDEMCALHSVKGHSISMKREISIFSDIWSLIKLVTLFIKIRPFVVHGNTPKASLLSMVAAWMSRVPNRIYYVHGLRYQGEVGNRRKILIFIEKITCFFATNIVAVSQGVKNKIAEEKISKKVVSVIWNGSINGIDLEYFSLKDIDSSPLLDRYNICKDDFVFGFIGRLVSDKGVNELVSGFKKISAVNKFVKLLLVGSYENELDPLKEETIEEIKNNPSIIYTGFQNDVRPFFKIMDLFVFPSYREGFGLVLIEAGAMGIPSISSDIIGCNEIIEDGKNGFLIQSKDRNVLLEKMRYCIENKSEIKKMGSVSRHYVLKFEQKQVWEKSLKLYQDLVLS